MEPLILLVIVLLCIYSIKSYIKKLQSGCCGKESDDVKKVRVSDKNPAHYPYKVKMSVKGMTCSHCKVRVENALNSLEGVWAKVDLKDHTALVHMKKKISDEKLVTTVEEAGYHIDTVEKV